MDLDGKNIAENESTDNDTKMEEPDAKEFQTPDAAHFTDPNSQGGERHILPLRQLAVEEEYTINDVLGTTKPSHPNIDHIRIHHSSESGMADMKMLHSTSRQDSFNTTNSKKVKSGTSLTAMGGGSSSHLNKEASKKLVGFAPEPPSYHDQHSGGSSSSSFGGKREPVHLDSSDGLIVASVFLPVHLHRSNEGKWSADWDYEALLSMQTHLRVIRVGVVKWRGWHGNKGADGSPEGGVPVNERHLVEKCLRPFNCLPVWVEPTLFGEM